MQRGLKTPSGLRGAPSFQGSGALLFSCPASRDGEGPALCGRASPLASLGDCLDGVGARREYARVVAQVAGGPSVVKAPLLGPERGPDGGDGIADSPAGTHRVDGDGASCGASASSVPLGTGSRSAGGLAYGSLDYFLGLWHVRHSSSLLGLLSQLLFIPQRVVHQTLVSVRTEVP